MDTGIYVALSKQIGTLRDMDATANNLANMTTTGYQGEDLLFSEYLTSTTRQENTVAFANDVATQRDLTQGTLQQTGNALDAAIEGSGYFMVQTPLGPRYTRNGSFKINGEGALVNSQGYAVLDTSGQNITFDPADRIIDIRDDGTVNVDGTERAQLKIVDFEHPQLMKREGNTLFSSDAPARPAQNFTVASGMLERSNVQSFNALAHMMYITRSVNETVKFITAMYALERKASDTLAKIYT